MCGFHLGIDSQVQVFISPQAPTCLDSEWFRYTFCKGWGRKRTWSLRQSWHQPRKWEDCFLAIWRLYMICMICFEFWSIYICCTWLSILSIYFCFLAGRACLDNAETQPLHDISTAPVPSPESEAVTASPDLSSSQRRAHYQNIKGMGEETVE